MKYLKLVVVVAILVFAFLFLRNVDFDKVALSIHRIGYNFVLLILITFTSYLFGTIAWRYCIGAEGKKISLAELFIIRHIGETISIINPASIVVGEATKIYLLRNYPVEKKVMVTSVLLSRILMMLTQMVLCLVTALFVLLAADNMNFNFAMFGNLLYPILLVCVVLSLIVRFRTPVKKLLLKTKVGKYVKSRTVALRNKINLAYLELVRYFIENKKLLWRSVMFFILHWIMGSFEFFVILHLLGVTAAFIPVMFADMSVILFKSAGAFVPAQVGIEEYGNKVMLGAIGITTLEIWVTASLLRRARQLFWIAFGLGAYFFIDRKRQPAI